MGSASEHLRSRRALLLGAAGGIAAVAAQALGRPGTAFGGGGQHIVVGGRYDTATSRTEIVNETSNSDVFRAASTGVGNGVTGVSVSNIGVVGRSTSRYGVLGTSSTDRGVYGLSQTGPGVFGQSNQGVGVRGFGPSGIGMVGEGDIGVEGEDASFAWGVGGYNQAENGYGIWGEANHSRGIGIAGSSVNGRGGWFNGRKAQIRLAPSTAVTHPTTGAAGDIFLDATRRVWWSAREPRPGCGSTPDIVDVRDHQ